MGFLGGAVAMEVVSCCLTLEQGSLEITVNYDVLGSNE